MFADSIGLKRKNLLTRRADYDIIFISINKRRDGEEYPLFGISERERSVQVLTEKRRR